MTEKNISIMLRTENKKLWKELVDIISSIEGVRLQALMDESYWDIFIMDVEGEPDKAFSLIKMMQSTGRAESFFLTSRDANPQILIQAISMGVKGFFPQPINREDVKAAILKIKEEKFRDDPGVTQPNKKGKIINVFGTKGGVGTTTIAVNLASNLAALEGSPEVVLVDMNLHFGEVPLFLGMEPIFDWIEVIKNISRLDRTYLMSILLKHPAGIHVLPAPSKFSDDISVNHQNIEDLFNALQSIFDYVVVDIGQSLDGVAKTLIRMSNTLLLVTLLSLPCLINTRKLQSTLRYLGYPYEESIKVIVNRYVNSSDISLKDGEKSINKKFFFSIPNDYDTTMRAINLGKPIRMINHGSEISNKFMELAHTIAGKSEKKKLGLFFRPRRS